MLTTFTRMGGFFLMAVMMIGCSNSGSGGGEETPESTLLNGSSYSMAIIAPGAQCSSGGVEIYLGIDDNGNGTLDLSEIEQTEVICHGTSGDDGINGLKTLIETSAADPASCPNGGIKFEGGLDSDNDGMLDPDEIALGVTEYICNGENSTGENGLNSLISMSDEPMGANCPYSGVRIDSGLDSDSSGVLDISEIEQTKYVCSDQSNVFEGIVFTADKNLDDMLELYANVGGEVIKLAAPSLSTEDITGVTLSPDNTKVLFYMGGELYCLDLLTQRAPIRIHPELVVNGAISTFAWSPDGSRIAYCASQETDGVYELYTVFPDGSGNKKISGLLVAEGDVHSFNYDWSPDSSKIFYMADQDTNNVYELYTVSPDGKNRVKVNGTLVAGGQVKTYFVDWSPDSSKIVYMADQDTDNVNELYAVFPDGSGNVKINAPLISTGAVVNFSWSPDSTKIAYRADQDTDNVNELYSVSPDGSGNTKVSGTLVAGGTVNSTFGWSPDSSKIVYSADQDTDNVSELYTVFPDGSGNVKINGTLVAGGSASGFEWSPDGSKIAYKADQDADDIFDLYTVSPDGSGNVKVNGTLVAGGDIGTFDWSPDSSKIVYKADQDVDNIFDLYTVSPDGSSNVKINGTLVAGGSIMTFGWLSDSSKIIYHATQDTSSINELYTTSPDGSDNVKVSGNDMPDFGDVSSYRY